MQYIHEFYKLLYLNVNTYNFTNIHFLVGVIVKDFKFDWETKQFNILVSGLLRETKCSLLGQKH